MLLPPEVDTLITDAWQTLKRDPLCQLKPIIRLALYDACGPAVELTRLSHEHQANFEVLVDGHKRYLHLTLITARQVLPIWEAYMQSLASEAPEDAWLKNFPHRLLADAEAILNRVRPRSLSDDDNDPYTALGALPYVVTYEVIQVAEAAYGALMAANGYVPFQSIPKGTRLEDATDLELDFHGGNWDVAWHAAQASCAIDHDPVGAEQRSPIEYDLRKRRMFWEWWLTEAIPAVWS